MERIVGELGGDFGTAASTPIRQLPDGSAEVDGLALVTDINEQFGLEIDEETYTTLGGYMLGRLGRRPKVGDVDRSWRPHAARRGRRRPARVARADHLDDSRSRRASWFLQSARSNLMPFAITSSDAPMSATTAIHNVAEPDDGEREKHRLRDRATASTFI